MKPARLLLVGMMGAGKSTVGHRLAERTGWPYLDNDEVLQRSTGELTADVLALGGEAALRAAESAALRAALATPPPVIASVAAGVVTDAGDRARLAAGGQVVYLRARLETLTRRVTQGPRRPWLVGDPAGALAALYAGREALYREVAKMMIDVDDLTPDGVCDRILGEEPG